MANNNWKEILRSNYVGLSQDINTDDGLKGEMLKLVPILFTEMALKKIWSIPDPQKRVSDLLLKIQQGSDAMFSNFKIALVNSGQGHLVERYLSKIAEVDDSIRYVPDSVSNPNDPRYRIVSDSKKRCLRRYHNELISEITFDDLFRAELAANDVYRDYHLKAMMNESDPFKRNEKLLDFMSKGSEKQWTDVCEVLYRTKQEQVVINYLRPQESTAPPCSAHFQNPVIEKMADLKLSPKVEEVKRRRNIDAPPAEMEVIFDNVTAETLADIEKKVQAGKAYPIHGEYRGLALVINNFDFNYVLPYREGAKHDASNLKTLFEKLHFHWEYHENKSTQEIRDILDVACKWEHHKQSDCFVLFFLSHGKADGMVFGADGEQISIRDIWNSFNGEKCKELIEKPKMFFFQACQGRLTTKGVVTDDAGGDHDRDYDGLLDVGFPKNLKTEDRSYVTDATPESKIHPLANMFLAYSVVDGYVAWRHEDYGSFFVRCFIDEVSRCAHKDDIQTIVSQVIGRLHDLCITGSNYKQLAKKEDCLLKQYIYLLPEGDFHRYNDS